MASKKKINQKLSKIQLNDFTKDRKKKKFLFKILEQINKSYHYYFILKINGLFIMIIPVYLFYYNFIIYIFILVLFYLIN